MHGRDDQAAHIAGKYGEILEGKFDDRSSSSEHNVPGEMPPGKQVGDMKPDGL